jgi:hypothetical protein
MAKVVNEVQGSRVQPKVVVRDISAISGTDSARLAG